MAKTVIKVKIELKLKGGAWLFGLLLGVYGVHHAQPYDFSMIHSNPV